MHVPYTHLLAAVATTTLIASAGYQQAQLPSQIETALLDLVNGVNSTQLPDGLTLKATQQQHTPSLFRSSGQLSLGFSTATYNLQYTLQYEVRHGISALFNGAALSAKLINIDSSEPDNSSEERFLVHRQPALFNGTLKPGRVEITGTIPALTGNSPGLLLSSQPAAIAFSASQPGSQQHWSQSHFRLKVPALKLWEDHSRAEGLTLTDLCIEAGQKKAGETLSATMETRLSQLEIKSRTQLLQLSDLQLNNDIQLQDSLSILWSLHFNRFSSRYVQLRNGHIQLALQDIDGDAVRQLINIGQQTSLQNWSAERIRSTYAQQLEAAATRLLARNPQLTFQASHLSVPTSNSLPGGDINFSADIQLDHTKLPGNFIAQLADNKQVLPQLTSAIMATLTVSSRGPATELAQNLIRPAGQPFEQAIADGNLNFQLENGIATLDNHPLR